MKTMKKLLLSLVVLGLSLGLMGQGTTTSEMNGTIKDDTNAPLEGATVVAVHTPTGSQYGAITNDQGYFTIPLMDVGGPYTVTVSYVGYAERTKSDIFLQLGQSYSLNTQLSTTEVAIAEVAIIGTMTREYDLFDGNRTGAETVLDKEDLHRMPTLSGDINDFTRYTPQARVVGDGISFAGMNNRYNSVMVDGTVNNDVFGLASNGMNGGQTGVSAFSYEAIEQFQITLAPYDVRSGGFAGAGINAVTKSGTNSISGSVYFKYRNQGMAGKTPTDDPDYEREKLPEFSAKTYGFNLGGPIIKNKLFFFANVELQDDQTPVPYIMDDYIGNTDAAGLQALRDYSINNYNYDPGTFGDVTDALKGQKFFLKLDWVINNKHKLMVRNQYTYGESTSPGNSDYNDLYYSNSGVFFPSTTNTTAIELKSRFSPTMSNNLKVSYASVHDNREVMGDKFPGVTINDGSGTIHLGGEVYSTGNELKQNILTITDNFQMNMGKHTLTIGTHNEFYSIYNLFMRRAYGYYDFDDVPNFEAGSANEYRIGYSMVDDIRGDGSAAAADFNAMQLGFYVQDEIRISDQFKLTAGLRMDIPIYTDQPLGIDGFNENTIPVLETEHDLQGAESGKMPFTQFLFSPRLGFNWDVTGEKTTQVRGGIGIFTSRVPFVWPAGSYTNNGLMVGDFRDRNDPPDNPDFNPDWQTQYVPPSDGTVPSGSQIDLYAKDFKLPQMLKVDLSVDQKLPGGVIATLEGIFTKTINNVAWQDVNMKPAFGSATGTPDDRPLYDTYRNGLAPEYGQIMLGGNTNEGYAYNMTLQLRKNFAMGLNANIAYTYGKSYSVFDGTSSQNSSQWNYLVSSPVPKNSAEVGVSGFDPGSRIVGNISYAKEYIGHLKTMVSLSYIGQSGRVVSYIYNDYYGNFTGEAYKTPQLIFVPETSADIILQDPNQWNDLDEFISSNEYLDSRRGQYAERNGSRLPWENRFDFRIAQDIFVNAGDRRQTLQLTFDIFNIGNMINKDWGRIYYASNGNLDIIAFEDFQADGTTPEFSFNRPTDDKPWRIDDSGLNSSRWQAQLGVRYIF